MTKVLPLRERKALMNEAIEMLERACDVLDECGKRHEIAMRKMEGAPNEKLPINSWQDSRYGRLCV